MSYQDQNPHMLIMLLTLMIFAGSLSHRVYAQACMIKHPTGFTTVSELCGQNIPVTFLLEEYDHTQFVLELPFGTVINEGGIVTAAGKILRDTETYQEDQQRLLKRHRDITQEPAEYFDGRLVVLSSPGQENWYHWLLQVIPRLKILKESRILYDKIYIDNMIYPWQKESLSTALKVLDIAPDRLLLKTGDQIIQARTLVVPSIAHLPSRALQIHHMPSWLKTFLHQCFLITNHKQTSPQYIYISRAKARVRRVHNEANIISFLTSIGFSILVLEELSPQEQAEYFHNARIIVGSHGSGFTNLVFTKPDTIVIEIDHQLEGDDQRSYFRTFASLFGCKYIPFYTDQVCEEELEEDLHVDMPNFIACVQGAKNNVRHYLAAQRNTNILENMCIMKKY